MEGLAVALVALDLAPWWAWAGAAGLVWWAVGAVATGTAGALGLDPGAPLSPRSARIADALGRVVGWTIWGGLALGIVAGLTAAALT